MFDHLLESSHHHDSNKWPSIGFREETTQVVSIEVNFAHLIWISDYVIWCLICCYCVSVATKSVSL